MLSAEERLLIGLKALERLKPNIRFPANWPPFNRYKTPVEIRTTGKLPAFPEFSEITGAEDLPSMEALLTMTGELPPYSLILGVCNDGVPLRLDLTNPAPGSMLIAGDPQSGKTSLFHSILASTVLLNQPKQVSFSLIVNQPDEYMHLNEVDHLQGFYTTAQDESTNLIQDLCSEFHTRQAGAFKYAHLLLIDDLGGFIQACDEELIAKFLRLVKHGPRYGMWTIASLSSRDAGWLDEEILRAFRTHILGFISDPRIANHLSGDQESQANQLVSGIQFTVSLGGEWIQIWSCAPEAEDQLAELGEPFTLET